MRKTKTGTNLLLEKVVLYYYDQFGGEDDIFDFHRPSLLILNYDKTKLDRNCIDLYTDVLNHCGNDLESRSYEESIHQNLIPEIKVVDWNSKGRRYLKKISQPELITDYDTFVGWCECTDNCGDLYISIEFKDFLKFYKKRMKELEEW